MEPYSAPRASFIGPDQLVDYVGAGETFQFERDRGTEPEFGAVHRPGGCGRNQCLTAVGRSGDPCRRGDSCAEHVPLAGDDVVPGPVSWLNRFVIVKTWMPDALAPAHHRPAVVDDDGGAGPGTSHCVACQRERGVHPSQHGIHVPSAV